MVAGLGKNPDHPDGAPPPAVDSAGVYLGVSLEDLNYGQLRRKGECELGTSSEPTGLRAVSPTARRDATLAVATGPGVSPSARSQSIWTPDRRPLPGRGAGGDLVRWR